MRKGFGLIEVLAAAIVLAFLMLGLNTLQKGNRDGVLRIRARDAASAIAQEIIDSLTAIGSARIQSGRWACANSGTGNNATLNSNLCRTHSFNGAAGNVTMPYSVMFEVKPKSDVNAVTEQTEYTKNTDEAKNILTYQFSKQIDVTVNWKFKDSDQSINMSTVIR